MSKRRDSSGSDASVSRIPISFTPTLPRRQRSTLSRNPSLHSLRTSGSRCDDTDSICSGSSSICEHSHFAKNGSTYSGRSNKYIVHCSPQKTDPDEYLTPTQRTNATIRKLKSMLSESRAEVAAKDEEISRLSRELVQLRLGQVDQIDHREDEESPVRRSTCGLVNGAAVQVVGDRGSPHSLSDSGHFDELSPEPSLSRNQLSPFRGPSCSDENLTQKLAEANERLSELKPLYEEVCKKLELIEFEKAELQAKFEVSEETHRKTYLEMFRKGQEAAKFQAKEEGGAEEEAQKSSVPQLMKELEVTKAELESVKDVEFWNRTKTLSGTEAVSIWNMCRKSMYRKLLETSKMRKPEEAEITLQFLKSAFYYLITDRENMTGHLSAIQGILGFNAEERAAIEKATYFWK